MPVRLIRALALVAFLLPAAAFGDARIEHLAATASNGMVSVHFNLRDAFREREIVSAIQNGVPTGFTYYVQLVRKRPNWFDQKVSEVQIEVVCTFNAVTQEYLLNYRRDKKLVRSETFSDLAEMQKKMTEIDETSLFALDGYRPSKMIVRARADVMRSVVLFVVPWDVSTGWKETKVRSSPK